MSKSKHNYITSEDIYNEWKVWVESAPDPIDRKPSEKMG